MNRYSQLSFSDFGQKVLPQLPFDQLDQVLGQFQQQKDTTDNLAAQEIDFLQADPDAQFKAKVDTEIQGMKDRLVESAASGDVGNYMTDLRETQRELLKMRSPGGKIKALADRKQQYGDEVKRLRELLKDAPKEYLDQAISEIQIGDVESPYGGYNSISGPNIGEYINIGEDLMTNFKGYAADSYDWIKVGDQWVHSGSKEVVSPEEVRNAVNTYLSQPRFQDQLQREARIRGISDADRYNAIVNSATAGKSTVAIQEFLKEQGFDPGAIDGAMGPKTQRALQEYANSQLESGNFDDAAIRSQSLINSYVQPVVDKYAYTKTTQDIDANSYGLIKARKAAEKTNTFVNGLIMPGPTVEREKPPKPGDFIESFEGNKQKAADLKQRYDELKGKPYPNKLEKQEMKDLEAEMEYLEFSTYQNSLIMERAEQLAEEQIDLDREFTFGRNSFMNDTEITKDLYKQTEGMSKIERQNYIMNYFKQHPQVVKPFVDRYVQGPGRTLVNGQPLGLSSAVNVLVRKMETVDNKRQKAVENNIKNTFENMTDVSAQGIVISEAKEGKQFTAELLKGGDYSSIVIHNKKGPMGKEKQDIFGTKNSEEILMSENFNLASWAPAGLFGKPNIMMGTHKETGEVYYVEFKDSNVDQIALNRMIEDGNPEYQDLTEVMTDYRAGQFYRDISSLPVGIGDKIMYNNVPLTVEKQSNGTVKVSTDDGQSKVYSSSVKAALQIKNSFNRPENN